MTAISPITQILEGTIARHGAYQPRSQERLLLPGAEGRVRVLRFALLGLALLLPLVVVPGLEQPFSRPKLILWAAVVLCGLASCTRKIQEAWGLLPQHFRAVLALWVGALSSSALWGKFASLDCLLLPLIGVGWFVLLLTVRPEIRRLSWALVFSGSAVAALALAQFFHADPFAVLGWVPASAGNSRMLVFATLGNPDFVAAFLAGLLPLTFSLASESRRGRWLLQGLSALQLTAILATGSRAPILGLAAAWLWMTGLNARRSARVFGLAALSLAVLAASISPARNLSTTLAGRSYIWRVSAPHLTEHFLLGLGPGGFAASFPAWEVQYWSRNPDDRDRKFAAVEDHAHNDYLEIFADYGLAGVLGFLAVLAAFLPSAGQRLRSVPDPFSAGASGGVVALAAVALVDFPLMRPTELFLLWSLMAIGLHKHFKPPQISKLIASGQLERRTHDAPTTFALECSPVGRLGSFWHRPGRQQPLPAEPQRLLRVAGSGKKTAWAD